MFTAQGPYKCCVLEGSPRYRGGTVVQFAQVRLVIYIIYETDAEQNLCLKLHRTGGLHRGVGGTAAPPPPQPSVTSSPLAGSAVAKYPR